MSVLDKPLVICLGFPKCATTWIHRQFEDHLEIGVTSTKEIGYWLNNYSKGEEWYVDQFPHDSPYKIYAEVTPHYMNDISLARMANDLYDQDVKYFVCIRNPYDRSFSHYNDKLRSGRLSGTICEAMQEGDEILDQSLYVDKLKIFKKYFSEKEIKVFYYDDLLSDPGSFANDIFKYINVGEKYSSKVVSKKYNTGRKATKFDVFLKKAEMMLKKLGLKRSHLMALGIWGVLESYYKFLSKTRPAPEISYKDIELMESYLQPSIEELRTVLDDVPESW